MPLGQQEKSESVTHTTTDLATASAEVLAENTDRKWALFINDSSVAVYLKIGATAVANQGIRFNPAGGSFEMSAALNNPDTRAVNCIAASGSGNTVLVTEG